MRNAMKVAKWEIKRNMRNKTFLIGLFITPLIIIGFVVVGAIFGDSDEAEGEEEGTQVFINDQLQVFDRLQETVEQSGFNWELTLTDLDESEAKNELRNTESSAYIYFNEETLADGVIPVYTSEEIDQFFINQVQIFETPLQALQMERLGFSEDDLAIISRGFHFEEASTAKNAESEQAESITASQEEILKRAIPGALAGFIMLSIVFTGMAIFQSASLEKKDKIAEIILSSLTPGELMQGKIIGYFVLGIIQSVVTLALVLPVILWRVDDIPILEYLLVPELLLLILIAILGYLLFASIFVGVGATMADMTTAGNFQGMVMMLPFIPFMLIGPVVNDPSGLTAQIGSYVPFTAPGVLILRLSLLEEWPWMEIIISLVILIISIWIFMKLAGKIFKVGILMYGKNATPKEIWKWIRA